MSKTTLTILDGKNVERKITVEDNGVDGLSPYHLEDAVQRSALVASITGITTAVQNAGAAQATATKQDQMITALNSLVTTSSSTDPVNVVSATFATASKQDSILAAIAALLRVNTVVAGTPIDHSGTITTAATAQSLMAANANRRGYWVQNNGTNDLWINEIGTAAASQPSMRLPAGAFYETPSTFSAAGAVSIFGATAGQTFSAREW